LTLWLDYGADFYAGVTWNNLPETDGRRVLIGWMNNWQYAQDIPTDPWRSAQSLPRSLGLRQTRDGIRLVQLPVEELGSLATPVHNLQHFPVEGRIRIEETIPELFRLDAELDLAGASRAGFVLHYGDDNETLVGYDAEKQELFIDRRASGMTAFHEAFPGIHAAPLAVDDGILSLHLFADRSSIEVFAEDGLVALTDRIFPEGPFNGLSIWSEGGSIEARRLDINAMASIWQ
jgi:fructan beta-fructosidase